MASQLVFKFITDNSKLNKGLGDARKQLNALDRTTQGVSRNINRAFGALGIGLGISSSITDLKEAARAAVEDSAAQALLAASIRNVRRATDEEIASTEKFIGALQNKTGILDDKLRPAYATIIRSTKDLRQTERLLTISTDVAAGSGKDLAMVSQAVAKAFNGQFASLNKLIPGISKAKDPIAELELRFGGLARVAAEGNPLSRIAVIFNDMQELIGMYLLPRLSQFAAYLESSEGQKMLQKMVELAGELITGFSQVLRFLSDHAKEIAAMILSIGVLRGAWGLANLAVAGYTFVVKGATVATNGLKAALVSSGIGAVAVALGTLASQFMTVDDTVAGATQRVDEFGQALDEAGNIIIGSEFAGITTDAVKPLNPQPGQVYTWFNYSDKKNPNLAVWWTQTWTGTDWTAPKKMTYDAGAGQPKTTNTTNPAMQAELDRLNSMADQIRNAGKRFRDAFDLSSGLNETGDVFNVDTALAKVRKIVAAAKKVPGLLKQLKAKGASPSMLTEIFGLGPVGAQATASALLKSESLGEFIKAEQTLTVAGQNAGVIAGQSAGTKTYSININKANMTAEEIIAAIKAYEKKTGTKVVFGG